MRTAVPAALYERREELEALKLALDEARTGGGGVVALLGPAVIGKSRLLSAAGELAQANGLEILGATGAETEREPPFGVALQLFERQRTVPLDHLKRPEDSKRDHRLGPPSPLPPHPNSLTAASLNPHVYQP